MKESIYTIPINDAFAADCDCPFCYLYTRLQQESVEYTLGASMMEADVRIKTNRMGFCQKHYSMLLEQPNKLSLALVLETHLAEVRKRIGVNQHSISTADAKKSLFSSKSAGISPENLLVSVLDGIQRDCAICGRIDETMERYTEVFFYMWDKDSDFRAKFDSAKGFCLPHYKNLAQGSEKYLKHAQKTVFLQILFEKQQDYLSALQDDITHFVKKFDYRNTDMPWDNAQDAPKRTVSALAGEARRP